MAESNDLLEQVVQLLALGHESRSFEVKGPLSLADKAHCAKVARAVIAMGNLRDGGIVLIGVDETQMTEMLPGLSDEDFGAWSDFDNVSDALALRGPASGVHPPPAGASVRRKGRGSRR